MKRSIFSSLVLAALAFGSCTKQLDVEPKGVLNPGQVFTPEGAEKFVIAAYSQLGNDHYDVPFSLWPYGNGRSDDQYKGGRDENDIQEFHFIQTFYNTRTDFGQVDALWYNLYVGVARANDALNAIEPLTEAEYAQKKTRQAEMRFLRGHFYFQLKTLFKHMPYLDEKTPKEDYPQISNVALTDDQLWEKIADDFTFASENLPDKQPQVGRADKYAAYAYLAKTRLYQAYKQDDKHAVTGIDAGKLQAVVAAADKVLTSPYRLEADFANSFLPGTFENGPESVFAVQYSVNDNTLKGRVNFGDVLSVPQGLGCCDFNKPSQNLVNAFRTGADGLPLFDTYNDANVNPDADNVDPRLDHTVAIPGHAWKYEPDRPYEENWNRSPGVYSVYASLKENVSPDAEGFVNIDPFYGNSKNRIIIRYADVLLFKAEALIELGRQDEALPLINALRERAANSTGKLRTKAGQLQAHYKVEPYKPGVNVVWDREGARKALRWERRLEFAMENSRFFDLVRWGIADQVLNAYFTKEKTRRDFLKSAQFTKGKHEYLPIPQNQIFFSKQVYQQNTGY
ncbi:RagB/SusD family nutrient uptake outer membrane protein [Paraflavisolibacter sp. H34]|uniref:RagB/SusD family nutrient uptake outer membrane protein n=1 Tax=Huijunlia imazamoxiresistens TaxID=3127457 RepID=UPI00301AB4B5